MNLEKKWVAKFEEVPRDFLESFKDYPLFLRFIFWYRDLKDRNSIKKFLSPNWDTDLHDPSLLLNIQKASERILRAVKGNEKVIVFGDYDADGVTGSSLLYYFFKKIGFDNFDTYLPDRKDGYGLSLNAVKKFKEKGADLIITNDCGVTNVEEVAFANKLGIDVIVTDHHLPQKEVPPALAVIDPNLKDDEYPFKFLSGAGVVFKLLQHLLDLINSSYKESFEKWSADLLAISAIADWVPLIDENRVFTKFGLITLNKSRKIGIQALKKVINLKEIESRDVAFIIAPMLNSASRIDHANTAFELLITDSISEAEWLAKRLLETNKERQRRVKIAYHEALEKIPEPLPKIIAIGSPSWSLGTISNLSSRLREEFSRPVFLWREQLFQIKGSARSIEGFNLVEIMEEIAKKYSDFFVSFGGHAMAAGFTLKTQYLKNFLDEINKQAEVKLKPEDLIPRLEIDFKLTPEEFNEEFFHYYNLLKPFGVGNQEPNILIEKAKVKEVSSVGENGDHLKLKIEWGGKIFDAISFGQGKDWERIKPDDYLDLVFNIRESEWQGEKKLDFYILDWRPSS